MEIDEWITGTVSLKVSGEPVEMQMTVPAKPVRLRRMLPIFHKMANAVVDASVEAAEAAGQSISCKAGCGACCRQPVPISEAEAFQLSELVAELPEPQRSEVERRFAAGAEHFHKIGWFAKLRDRAEQFRSAKLDDPQAAVVDLVLQYFAEGVPCPFLENEACSVYDARPAVCREYLVTSPPENCAEPTAATVRVLPLMMRPSLSVKRISASVSYGPVGFLPLIQALEVASSHTENTSEKTGQEWMADFFGDVAAA